MIYIIYYSFLELPGRFASKNHAMWMELKKHTRINDKVLDQKCRLGP
jgi:hypothetical protein